MKLNYGDYLTYFKLLCRDFRKLPVFGNILERLKVEIRRDTFSSYDNYSFWDELNNGKEERLALKGLSTNGNLILQKLDTSNSAGFPLFFWRRILGDLGNFRRILF